jgi:hypothetical protein
MLGFVNHVSARSCPRVARRSPARRCPAAPASTLRSRATSAASDDSGNLEGGDGVTVGPQPVDDRAPAGAVGPRAVDQDDIGRTLIGDSSPDGRFQDRPSLSVRCGFRRLTADVQPAEASARLAEICDDPAGISPEGAIPMEDAMDTSTAGRQSGRARRRGLCRLHVAVRLTAKLRNHPEMEAACPAVTSHEAVRRYQPESLSVRRHGSRVRECQRRDPAPAGTARQRAWPWETGALRSATAGDYAPSTT